MCILEDMNQLENGWMWLENMQALDEIEFRW
jgi:hypothetical protein